MANEAKTEWTQMSGSWKFRAKGNPSRENIDELLKHFLAVCPEGAKITQWNMSNYGADEIMVQASWSCERPVELPS